VLLGNTGVVLVWLYQSEIGLGPNLKTVVAVKQNLGVSHKIYSVRRCWCAREGSTEIEPIVVRRANGKILGHLQDPYKLLDGVIEIEADLICNLVELKGFCASKLKLIDQILMRHLGETAALFGVEVDVIHPQGGRLKRNASTVHDGSRIRCIVAIASGTQPDDELRGSTELKDDLDLMILKRD
jgi:hypothetical protein